MKLFEKPDVNLANPKASVDAQVAAWNEYYEEVKEEELDPLFVQMRDAKAAYFTAVSAVKTKAMEIMKEYNKLNEDLIRMYAPSADLKRTDISYEANRSAYITPNEITSGKIIN